MEEIKDSKDIKSAPRKTRAKSTSRKVRTVKKTDELVSEMQEAKDIILNENDSISVQAEMSSSQLIDEEMPIQEEKVEIRQETVTNSNNNHKNIDNLFGYIWNGQEIG